jgi:uncharacterized protein (DUF58 family)
MSPSPRAAAALAAAGGVALLAGPFAGALAAIAVVAATVADAWSVRAAPTIDRRVVAVLARGIGRELAIDVDTGGLGSVRLRQPTPADVAVEPPESDGRLRATITASRRGRHVLPPVAVRREGPLGLGRTHHRSGGEAEVRVYPDHPSARRLALALRQGRRRELGRLTRGPLGLGTDLEGVREYLPDDDIRQVNWPATQRVGRPMSNQYRVEQDREVVLAIDAGRLMRAPAVTGTLLDAAVDAAVAVATVADELGDRCGVLAFDSGVRRRLAPRRGGGRAVLEALLDLEPSSDESDYELAFRTVAAGKRALVVVLTDLLDEAAARPLVDAVPILSRHHALVVGSASDPELDARLRTEPEAPVDVFAAAVALEVLAARRRAAHSLRRAGARTVEAPPEGLAAACVRAYLTAKERARL